MLATAWLEHMVTVMNRVLWKLLVMIPNRVWVHDQITDEGDFS